LKLILYAVAFAIAATFLPTWVVIIVMVAFILSDLP
jgi:hypothetical protein